MGRIIAFIVLTLTAVSGTAFAEPGLPRAVPEEVGLSSERLERVTAHFTRYVDEGKLAGLTVAIARHGKLAYFKTFGAADIEAELPADKDTLYRLYSMTKPITAVAVMMLVEEGRLRLSDPISQYLPEFAGVKVYAGEGPDGMVLEDPNTPISVRHLLTHTSGLTYGNYDQSAVGALYRQADELNPGRSLPDLTTMAAALPLALQPGGDYQYGISFDVLGRVIEVISGKSFGEFLRERVFEPLGMEDTQFFIGADKRRRFAQIYEISDDGNLVPWSDQTGTTRFLPTAKLESGGGGLVSTAGDYLRFSQMLLNGGVLGGTRILSRASITMMTTNQLLDENLAFIHRYTPGWGVGYGLGILNDIGAMGHLGSVGGYRWDGGGNTYFFVDPTEDLVVLLLTQMRPFGLYPLREEMMNLTYQAIVD